MKPNPKPRRGPTKGNGGAPKKSDRRVNLSCRVSPETLIAIKSLGPVGLALDRKFKPKKK